MSILGAFLSNKKTGGKDSGNAFNLSPQDMELAKGQLANVLNYQGNQSVIDPIQGSRTAAQEVQNNPLLSDIFGKDGTMSRTTKEEQDLASRGFSLKPEDYEAYGQASDNIAREFGMSEGNLAQALSNRGLSSSAAAAGQSFAGLQGNKMEQLGQMQRKIANDRMQSNLARLGQTRNFLQGLSSQAGTELDRQNTRQTNAEKDKFNQLQMKNQAAMQRLGAMQGQANENLGQRQQTEHQSGWAAGLGALGGLGEQVGMAYATGGLSAAGGGGGAMSGAPTAASGTSSGMPNENDWAQYAQGTKSKNGDWASYMAGK